MTIGPASTRCKAARAFCAVALRYSYQDAEMQEVQSRKFKVEGEKKIELPTLSQPYFQDSGWRAREYKRSGVFSSSRKRTLRGCRVRTYNPLTLRRRCPLADREDPYLLEPRVPEERWPG